MGKQTIGVRWEPDTFSEYTLVIDPNDYVGVSRDEIAVGLEDELEHQLRQKVEVHCPDFDRYVDEIFAAAQQIEQEENASDPTHLTNNTGERDG